MMAVEHDEYDAGADVKAETSSTCECMLTISIRPIKNEVVLARQRLRGNGQVLLPRDIHLH